MLQLGAMVQFLSCVNGDTRGYEYMILDRPRKLLRKKKTVMKERRVVVTGMAAVTPIGHNPKAFYNNLLEDVRGISEIEVFDGSHFPTVFSDALEALTISRSIHSVYQLRQQIWALQFSQWIWDGWDFCILRAANHTIRGEVDMMLCGGSDAVIIPIGLGGFVACETLSQRDGDQTKASRPWDIGRGGFVMGEGARVFLLEELEHAKKRGAYIYAEFLGGSFTCDAYDMTEPHPEGCYRVLRAFACFDKKGAGLSLCMEKAMAQSGIARKDVNYINAHATSTQAEDVLDYRALIHCFGQNPELRVNSTKSMIGHLLGTAGAVEAVATIQAIRTGWIHPNINLENPDDGVDKKVLVGSKKGKLDIKVALSNSFGFGGQNSSILFSPYK
ncbi:3-oxoacyl-[acyl-carrier-protein] synthase [Thalictrum thalictroides]|uniref:beta-ketoacyl-[acyl-carrier-protein] synthase I n=1 Tax=Thalictrum thalictroides TaxID=46969 RepID=A0A7J6VF46_THATH|nr:3-oxoacyl-[acyl-carrier-protein] synthase [Thalictrum thalictroides]